MGYNFTDRNVKTVLHSWGRFRGTLLEAVVTGDLIALKSATSTSLQFADDVSGQAAIAVACENIAASGTGWCALAAELKAPTTIGTGGAVTQTYFDDGTDVDIGQALYLDDEGKADDTVGATTKQQVGYNVARDRILLAPGGMLTGAATFTTLLCTGAVSMTSTVAMTGVVTLSDATESTTSLTGALKIAGGVGIAKDLFVGVDLDVAGTMTAAAINASGTVTSTNTTTGFAATGAATNGLLVSGSCTSGINISVAQSDETGLDEACVFKHGTYSTVLAYGTQTAHLILKSTCISAASTGYYVFGDVLRITSSATSTGHLIGTYTYMSLGHTTSNTYAVRGRVDATATAELGLTNALMGEINVTAGTITQGTGGSLNGLHIDMNVTAGATIAQPIHGILVDTSGIAVDIAGEMIGIKVAHAGGSNYLDYGLKFSNCFDQTTSVIEFELSQGNTPIAIRFNAGTAGHIITSALTFTSTTGGTTYFADFSGGADTLPFTKTVSEKTGAVVGLISVKDQDGTIAYINVYA